MPKKITGHPISRTFLALAIVLSCGVLAILPFFGRGFIPTHDGEYHIIRFMEFDRMLREGYLFPRWAPTINSGYGLPLFEFMYPLPNYIASFLHLSGMEFVSVLKVSSASSYLLALVFCFLWLKTRFSLKSAVAGTIAAAFVPYWFVELYVRGSIGELWAITFLFAALFGIEKRNGMLLALFAGGIILSHNGLSLVFIPILILYVLYRMNWRWIGWIVSGVGITSWFWLPAFMEARYMTGLNTVRVSDHFAALSELLIPSWGTEFSGSVSFGNKMSLQIGIAVFVWMLYTLFQFRYLKKEEKREYGALIAITLLIVFMMLPVSTPLWNAVPFLSYLQYPWRLLVWFLPVTAWVAAVAIQRSKNMWIPILLTVISVVSAFSYTRGAVYEPRNDAYYQSRENFTDGTSSMGNSLSTVWTVWKEKRAPSIVTDTSGTPIPVTSQKERYLDRSYQVNLELPRVLRVHILYFPGWTVSVDGKPTAINYTTNGTLDIAVPAGIHTVSAAMHETPVRRIGTWISITSLVITVGLSILLYKKREIL